MPVTYRGIGRILIKLDINQYHILLPSMNTVELGYLGHIRLMNQQQQLNCVLDNGTHSLAFSILLTLHALNNDVR